MSQVTLTPEDRSYYIQFHQTIHDVASMLRERLANGRDVAVQTAMRTSTYSQIAGFIGIPVAELTGTDDSIGCAFTVRILEDLRGIKFEVELIVGDAYPTPIEIVAAVCKACASVPRTDSSNTIGFGHAFAQFQPLTDGEWVTKVRQGRNAKEALKAALDSLPGATFNE